METIGGDCSKMELVMKKKGKHKLVPASPRTTEKRRRATTYPFCFHYSNQQKFPYAAAFVVMVYGYANNNI